MKVSEFAADLSGHEGVGINGVTLRGPDLSADVSGLLAATADPKALKLDVRGREDRCPVGAAASGPRRSPRRCGDSSCPI